MWRHIGSPGALDIDHIFLSSAIGALLSSRLVVAVMVLYRNNGQEWSSAKVTPLAGGALEVSLKVPKAWKIRAGQFIQLWTPAAGFWSFFQSHPYVVAWWTEDSKGQAISISLLLKAQNGISRRLSSKNPSERFVVAVNGPYGTQVNTTTYNTLVLFATGIGIAAQLPVLKQAYMDYQAGTNIVRRISVIWQMNAECMDDHICTRGWR